MHFAAPDVPSRPIVSSRLTLYPSAPPAGLLGDALARLTRAAAALPAVFLLFALSHFSPVVLVESMHALVASMQGWTRETAQIAIDLAEELQSFVPADRSSRSEQTAHFFPLATCLYLMQDLAHACSTSSCSRWTRFQPPSGSYFFEKIQTACTPRDVPREGDR